MNLLYPAMNLQPFGFLVFSWDIKWKNWTQMDQQTNQTN